MTTPQIAQGLAGLGRNGDTMLMHVTPDEVQGLQSIAQAQGGSLTINPSTGLPEASFLSGFFRSFSPFLAGLGVAMIPGAPAFAPALAGGLMGAATNKKNPIMGAALGAAGGYGGGNMAGKMAEFGAASTAAGVDPITAAVNTPGMPIPTADTAQALPGNAFYGGSSGSIMQGPTIESTGIIPGGYGAAAPEATFGGNLQQAFSNVSQDPMGFVKDNAMGLGMPIGMAALSGLEAPTPGMTQEEFDAERRAKFNKPLNLNYDTGLRLAASGGEMRLAGGGAIAFDDGGSVPNSRLSLRRDEEQMAPMQNQQMMMPQQPQTELGIAALKPNQENDVSISINGAQPNQMQQQEQQVQPLATQALGEGIPSALQQLGGEGVNFEKLYGRTQAPAAMAPMGGMQPMRGFGPDGRRLAAGGAIQTGGVMDLYQGTDTQPTFGGSQGYGLGRLNSLAQQQSLTNAEQGRFARGGVPKLEDGGFVVPADVTFYMGDHNTEAGQERLAQMYGGQPIKGPGSGLSDSIKTSIEGKEPARIANGEVYIPRKAVMAHGGPEKFYKMMDKVRKKATGSTKQAKSA